MPPLLADMTKEMGVPARLIPRGTADLKPRAMNEEADQGNKRVDEAVLIAAYQVRKRGGGDDKTDQKEGANDERPENKHMLKEFNKKEDSGEGGEGKEDLVYPNRTDQGIPTRSRAHRRSPASTRA